MMPMYGDYKEVHKQEYSCSSLKSKKHFILVKRKITFNFYFVFNINNYY